MTAGTIEKEIEKIYEKHKKCDCEQKGWGTVELCPYCEAINEITDVVLAASKAQDKKIERLKNEHCYCKKCGHSLYVADDKGYTHFVDPCPNCKKDKRIKELRTVIKTLNEEKFV